MATNEEALASATDMYVAYMSAEKAILSGQAYSIGDRTVTRANLREVQTGRQYWAAQIQTLSAIVTNGNAGGSIRVKRIIPRDD